MTRIDYIDTMKGIAIILVLLFHTIDLPEHVACTINTLHNPSFYLASGIILSRSIKQTPKQFFLNKLKTLLYPFVLWVIIYSTIGFFFTENNLLFFYRRVLTCINRLWFLPTLFISSSIIYIYNYTKAPIKIGKAKNIIFSLCFLVGLYSSQLSKIAFYTFITWIGFYIADSTFEYAKERVLLIVYFLFSYLFLIFNDGYIHLNDTVVPGVKLSLFLSISVLGSFVILYFAKKYSNCSILQRIGRNSLYFYVLHFASLDLREFITLYNSTFETVFSFAHGIVTFLLALLIPILFIALFKKNIKINKFLFGK